MRRCIFALEPTKSKIQVFYRMQHYRPYWRILRVICTSKLCTLLGNFVHYWKKLYNTLFCSDKNEPPAKVSRWIFCSFPDPQWVLLQFSAGGQDVYQDLLFHHFVCKVTPVHILLDLVYLHLAHLTIFLRIFERTKKNWSIPEKILQNAVQMCLVSCPTRWNLVGGGDPI